MKAEVKISITSRTEQATGKVVPEYRVSAAGHHASGRTPTEALENLDAILRHVLSFS